MSVFNAIYNSLVCSKIKKVRRRARSSYNWIKRNGVQILLLKMFATIEEFRIRQQSKSQSRKQTLTSKTN
jgi:predicted DNA-binding helix-hairpin-helix protein